MSTTLTIVTEGRRHYLTGNTYPVRDQLRAAGCNFDGDRRAWWTGKRETAEKIVALVASAPAAPASAPAASEGLAADAEISGKAQYKGRTYLLVWQGQTRRGRAAKLATLDGKKVFWADEADVTVVKHYEAREYRGQTRAMTFGRLASLREKFARAKAEGHEDGIANGQRYTCPECGEHAVRGEGSCWETGATH